MNLLELTSIFVMAALGLSKEKSKPSHDTTLTTKTTMTAKKNKQYCEKCYRRVNNARIAACVKSDCEMEHTKSNVFPIKPHVKPKLLPAPTVITKPEEMVEIKCDSAEFGEMRAK
jgi:hypothetical protein